MNSKVFNGIVVAALSVIMVLGCSSFTKGSTRSLFLNQKDGGYEKMISDSIAKIIIDASTITCENQDIQISDSIQKSKLRKVPSSMKNVVKFLYLDKSNFQSNDTVYGQFGSWACFKFQKCNKKKVVYLELDFGLSKWRLLDREKKEICQADMKENNLQFLKLICMLFPDDKNFDLLYKNLKTK